MYKYANTRKTKNVSIGKCLGNHSETETDVVDARETVYAAVKT